MKFRVVLLKLQVFYIEFATGVNSFTSLNIKVYTLKVVLWLLFVFYTNKLPLLLK